MDKGILILFLGIFIIGSAMAAETITQNVTGFVINGTEINNESYSPLCVFKDTNITLSANISFKDCPGNVWVSVKINNKNYTNYTVTYFIGSVYYFVLDSSLLEDGANVSFQFYAKDCYNFTYNGSMKSFYVRKQTYLGVDPWPADGENGWYVTEPEFTLTKDSLEGKRYYQWDSKPSGPILYTGPFGLENIPNPPEESAGTLELNWWTDFGVCGNETQQSKMFYIDLTNPLIIDLIPEDESTVYNNLRPTISAYLDEVYGSNSGIDKDSIIIKVDGVDKTADALIEDADDLDVTVTYSPNYDLGFGSHEIYIYVKDNAGRESELNWGFTITETPVFSLTVHSPKNTTYDSKRVLFNITTTDDVETLEYINYADSKPRWRILCRNCDEYGKSKKKTQTLNEGWNNITIKATDSFGQVKEENRTLFIDSKEPKISKTEPKRNSVINGSKFLIKYTEDNLKNITLFYGYGTEETTKYDCEAGKNKECIFKNINLLSYDGQWIEYYFEVSDVINTALSKKTRVFVDTTSPELTVNMPEETEYGRKVPFNIIVSEDVLLEYIDNSVASPRWRTLCTRCNEYGNSRVKTQAFSRGPHDIQIRAVDKAGNSDTEDVSFEVEY